VTMRKPPGLPQPVKKQGCGEHDYKSSQDGLLFNRYYLVPVYLSLVSDTVRAESLIDSAGAAGESTEQPFEQVSRRLLVGTAMYPAQEADERSPRRQAHYRSDPGGTFRHDRPPKRIEWPAAQHHPDWTPRRRLHWPNAWTNPCGDPDQ